MNELLPITPDNYDAVLFDLDGVLTKTAKVHATCWKTMFDDFLLQYGRKIGEVLSPFDIAKDYRLYVDGKPRYEGVQGFLDSRKIGLPYGYVQDLPDKETICGLGNRKDQLVKKAIQRGEVEIYENSITWVKQLREKGIKTAVVSSSRNCKEILQAVAIEGLFDVRIDGKLASELGIPGKPLPDTFLKAAEMLAVKPDRAIVVEDAIVGVQSGRAGNFGLVIGVDRAGHADALKGNGADVVVQDLGEFL